MSQKPDHSPIGIIAHSAFLRDVDSAQFQAYKADPRIRVRSAAHFAEMQAHIKSIYDGVTVHHSFTDSSGHVFDCIPIQDQPSLRDESARAIPKAPDISGLVPRDHARSKQVTPPAPQLDSTKKDRHGNSMGCPPGTIPIRRLTLDQLCRYETLQDFFRKVSPALAAVPRPTAPDPDNEGNNHRYAITRQTVDNFGGHSFINIWQPAVNTPDQRMSLSQQWYSAGTGPSTQTAEVGWQVLPDKYGHSQPVLFIYWTPDNYSTGNYNLDASAFVQTNPNWAIGGSLDLVSTDGGQQYDLEVSFVLVNGNWWLYIGGTTDSDAVGYYPATLYNGGQMATSAQEISYGGETVCHAIGWGAMGSGLFANAGWQGAAYQRDIFFFPPEGGAVNANLTALELSPGCYSVDLGSAADPWNIYFFFGGPGGADC
jgi:hypothetical protein